MVELEDRLRRLADEHARHAQAPGVQAAIRRGRQRRRRRAGAVTLTLVLLAGLVGVGDLLEPSVLGPVAPATTNPCISDCVPPPPGPRAPAKFDALPGKFKVIATGDQPGYRWRLVARRIKVNSTVHELMALLQRTGHPNANPTKYLPAAERSKLSFHKPSVYDPDPNVVGIVTNQTAQVRLWIERNGAAARSIQVQPIDASAVFPYNDLFVVFVARGSVLRQVDLLDRRGNTICFQRMKTATRTGKTTEVPEKHSRSCLWG